MKTVEQPDDNNHDIDVLIAEKRMQEAKKDPTVMRPLSELRANLEAAGLLDSPISED